MAKIIWTDKAMESYDQNFIICEELFGRRATQRFDDAVFKKVNQITKYPLSCSPEPLLSNYSIQFRSCVVQKPVKMVYHYVEETDTIYIDNFWDMRRNPDALKGDI